MTETKLCLRSNLRRYLAMGQRDITVGGIIQTISHENLAVSLKFEKHLVFNWEQRFITHV